MALFREAIKPGLVTPMENRHIGQEVLEERADRKLPCQALTIRLVVLRKGLRKKILLVEASPRLMYEECHNRNCSLVTFF